MANNFDPNNPFNLPLVGDVNDLRRGRRTYKNNTSRRTYTQKLYDKAQQGGTAGQPTTSNYIYPKNLGSAEQPHQMYFFPYESINRTISSAAAQAESVNKNRQEAKRNQESSGDTNSNNADANLFVPEYYSERSQAKEFFGASKTYKLANELIGLPMPQDLVSSYSLAYDNAEMGLGAQAATTGLSVIDLVNTELETGGGVGSIATSLFTKLEGAVKGQNSADEAGRVGRSIASKVLKEISPNLFSGITREVTVPHQEYLFRGVNPRTFRFDFILQPKSPEEAQNIHRIIKAFKRHALPEVVSNELFNVFYKMPAIFDIVFYSDGKENDFLFKLSSCALTDIIVNYTGAGIQAFHRYMETTDGGAGAPPVAVALALQFTEIELMSQQRADEGF